MSKFQVSSPCSICHLVTLITSWPILMPRKVTEQRSFQTSSSDPKKVPVFVQILRRFATRSPRWWMKPLHCWSGCQWIRIFLREYFKRSGTRFFLMKVKTVEATHIGSFAWILKPRHHRCWNMKSFLSSSSERPSSISSCICYRQEVYTSCSSLLVKHDQTFTSMIWLHRWEWHIDKYIGEILQDFQLSIKCTSMI